MGYEFDREFTNTVHSKLAIPIIYKALGWTETEYPDIEYLDINKGIDYIMSSDNVTHSVQERFSKIGIEVLPSSMMVPQKSMIGVVRICEKD